MKICFIANADSIHSKKWVEYFSRNGHEIHWISLVKSKFGPVEKVNFYLLKEFRSKLFTILYNAISIRRLIRKISPDMLHAHYAGVNGVLGAISCFHPFVLTAWGSDILVAPKSRIVRPLVQFALKSADLITCDAEHMQKAMAELGANPSKINIIYFGIDTKKFSPGAKDIDLAVKLMVNDSPVVVSLRSLEPIYNVETLIMAIPVVLKEIPNVKFIIVGKGSEEGKLKNMAENLGISGHVRFIGFVLNDDLPKYLKTADVYVSTSLSDGGIASSTAEAMSCGLPVVITDNVDNGKWINNGESGFLFPTKNPEKLAEKTIYLLKNSEERFRLGQNARKIIEERNNYYKEMEKMEKIYEKNIKKS